MKLSKIVATYGLLWVSLCLCPSAVAQSPRLLEVEVSQQTLYGLPVHWGSQDAALLDSTGKFHLLDLRQVHAHRILDKAFVPQSLTETRSRLQAELGPGFDIQIAGPYVIAAPAGAVARWQSRFLALLAGYSRYFELRGWQLRKPDFPLVVIVFRSRERFREYAAQQSEQTIPNSAVGSYFPRSNRCILYEIPGYRGVDWSETEATIVHEAVHQLAYNTGVHERLFENPLWCVEGLATMFEQPAVYDLEVHGSKLESRILESKRQWLQPLLKHPDKLQQLIDELISADRLFRVDPQTAYALAWAMTFYLAERRPEDYQQVMRLQSQRPFGAYRPQQRTRDFAAACELDTKMFAQQLARMLAR